MNQNRVSTISTIVGVAFFSVVVIVAFYLFIKIDSAIMDCSRHFESSTIKYEECKHRHIEGDEPFYEILEDIKND